MRLMASTFALLIAASIAHAGDAAHSSHARTTLLVSKLPAEPLQAYPRSPVRVEKLVDGKLAELMHATDATHRDAVKTIAINICGNMRMGMADCLAIIVRENAFFLHEHSLMEAANKD